MTLLKGKIKKNSKRVLIILLVLTLGFIWGNSVLPRENSSAGSNRVAELLNPLLEAVLGRPVEGDLLVRKLAHYAEFGLLGCELTLLIGSGLRKRLLAANLALIAALIDETIQLFADRGSMVSDVWLDFAGAVTGIIFISVLTFVLFRKK